MISMKWADRFLKIFTLTKWLLGKVSRHEVGRGSIDRNATTQNSKQNKTSKQNFGDQVTKVLSWNEPNQIG